MVAVNKVYNLKNLELFSEFSKDQVDKLSKISQAKYFKKEEQIYRKGDKATELFVVIEGLVSLRAIDPGNDVGIAYEERKPGEFFGPASFMASRTYSLTAVCMTNTEVLAITAEQLYALCENDSSLGYKFMKKIAEIYFERYITTKRQICQMVNTPTIITALPG
jgi:CRP-like cAMP-binding protein